MSTKTNMALIFSETFIGAETAPETRSEAHALAQHWVDQDEANEDEAHALADAWCDVHGIEDEAEDDELTAEERDGQWTVVDTSGQRFWPEPAVYDAGDALAAARVGRGTWHQ